MPQPKSISKKSNYYPSINLFRGLSILFIVWGHMVQVFSRPEMIDKLFETDWLFLNRYFNVYVVGGTAYFVFISGFLFYAVFYKRETFNTLPGYGKFLKDKVLKVFCPYLIAVAFLYVLAYFVGVDLKEVGWGLFTFYTLWYVPFIMVVFIASPLYLEFIKCPKRLQLAIFAAATILSICIGRHNYNPVLSTIFWSSMYMFGILVAESWEKLIKATAYFKMTVLIISIFLATMLCCLPDHTYITDQPTWEINWGSYFEVQIVTKMIQSLCFVYILQWFYNRYIHYSESVVQIKKWFVKVINYSYKALTVLAKYSFTIFFYHTYFLLYIIFHPKIEFFSKFNFWSGEVVIAIATALVLSIITFIASILKKTFGKYSRSLVGA